MKNLSTSVLICGAGPVGLTLAHLLARENVDVVVIERHENTVTEPRAISIDGESLRLLQKLQLLEGLESGILSGLTAEYVNGRGELLFKAGRPDLRPQGYPTVNSFDQPQLDRYLAEQLAQANSVDIRFGHVLELFEQDKDHVRALCINDAGEKLQINAEFLIGCDGGRSTVRTLLGIRMAGRSNPLPWLVIDTKDSYLDDRMECRFFCDPERPGMTIRKCGGERRWEWMVLPGESREKLLEEAHIRRIIAPYTQADQVDIYRKRIYDFHALVAERWREGRVFLAGDAAHMTPPFAGQGLNSGFRDVSNLSWKLSAVVKRQADRRLLETYEQERRTHALELIQTALDLGEQIQPIDPVQAAERDKFFAEINMNQDAIEALEKQMMQSVMDRSIETGLLLARDEEPLAGKMLIQPEVVFNGQPVLIDEHLGGGFSIVGYNCEPAAILSQEELARWRDMGASIVHIVSPRGAPESQGGIVDEGLELACWLGSESPRMLIVRPDRFCMGAARASDAESMIGAAFELLTNQNQTHH